MAFFTARDFQIKNPAALGMGCGKCKLFRDCTTPKMEPVGEGKAGLMLIGDYPTKADDKHGAPFLGESGAMLKECLRDLGLDPYEDTVMLNAINCCPKDKKKSYATEVENCRGRVWGVIEKYKPKVIMPLGMLAIESLIGHRWPKKKDEKDTGLGSIERWFNWAIPDRQTKCWIIPNYSPARIYRDTYGEYSNPASMLWFEKCLRKANKHLDMLMPKYKDEESCVEIITDDDRCYDTLCYIQQDFNLIAFDYEGSGLKPYREGHRIWYIGIAYGPDNAIVFPTHGMRRSLRKFREIMENPNMRKIAHNMMYEDLWTRERLGVQVQGWELDTMLASHVLDQRPGIVGLKFQTYVRTGLIDYSSHISEYLSTPLNKHEADMGDNKFNQISLAPPKETMIYCGIDCIGAFRLALEVAKELKIDLV